MHPDVRKHPGQISMRSQAAKGSEDMRLRLMQGKLTAIPCMHRGFSGPAVPAKQRQCGTGAINHIYAERRFYIIVSNRRLLQAFLTLHSHKEGLFIFRLQVKAGVSCKQGKLIATLKLGCMCVLKLLVLAQGPVFAGGLLWPSLRCTLPHTLHIHIQHMWVAIL